MKNTVQDVEDAFEAERPRLVAIASRVLGDPVEAEDVVQQAWLRLDGTDRRTIDSLPAWLTTVTTRICLDRLKARRPLLLEDVEPGGTAPDPAEDVVLADTVAVALQVVLDRLTPSERVAFVLHDSFGVEHATVAAVLGTTPAAARKLASRARAKVAEPVSEEAAADRRVVDAFMAAARGGDLEGLLRLLAPDVEVTADAAALGLGTPQRLTGATEVAAFFDGSAHAALPVLLDDRPGYAWFDRGDARVLFDFTVAGGVVTGLVFRADPDVLARVVRRRATPTTTEERQ
ncbi:sigma-70 family RNA polymerase sigma factor [Nocardioides sp. CFH 31398]|uniref:sigma-70 family RNA polymerase sigma factor n=1 Tax=Nocardioides sp. CFH 31398 TaxID=2919579 RepID=UPI001F059062|nr:sigma-70 family RNA polymerase sigma factor [Nocardioides sp. CFH 31398]MCH1866675.1 sigma-70 family RNA polymerase sigma factor [Nocardioides sp. CFH 31398]